MCRFWIRNAIAVTTVTLVGCSFDTGGYNTFVDQIDAGTPSDTSANFDASTDSQVEIDALPRPDAPPPLPHGLLHSLRTNSRPTLDGLSNDWPNDGWRTFDIADADQFYEVHPSYVDSARIRFASQHDDDFVYFFFEVIDDLLVRDSGADLFNDDGILLYLDAQGDRTGPMWIDDHEIMIGLNETYVDLNDLGSEIQLDGDITTTDIGYNIEISIRKSSLGVLNIPGTIGFNVAIRDDDQLGDARADSYGVWHVAQRPHCPLCCLGSPRPWCDTSLMGQLLFR